MAARMDSPAARLRSCMPTWSRAREALSPLRARGALVARGPREVLLALGALLVAAPLSARTLQHRYELDLKRVVVERGAAGSWLRAEGLSATWEAGQPEVPYDIVTLLVPRGSRLAALRVRGSGEVVLADDVVLGAAAPIENDAGAPLDPRPPRLTAGAVALAQAPRGMRAAPVPDLAALGFEGGFYPAIQAEPGGGGALHGYQMISVRVYPVRYDAAHRRVVADRWLDLEVDLESDGALPIDRRRYSPAIEAEARRELAGLVANPGAIDGYTRRIGRLVSSSGGGFHPTDAPSLEGSPVEGVIVTSQALSPAWQALADWKTRRGVPTVVRTVEWIAANYRHGSDQQETIRTFIRDAYLDWGVQYVLLGGDTDVVPARYGWSNFGEESERSIPSDMYFACLDGTWNRDGDGLFGEAAINISDPGDSTDLYAEVYLGRAPVSTTAEVNALVSKIVTYENSPVTNYQQRYLFLGEVLFPVDWSPWQPITLDGCAYSEEMLALTGACLDTIRLYQNDTAFPGSEPLSRSRALQEMSAGPGFVNHIGHGYRYNMSLGDVSMTNADALALTNFDRRFILYMVNCTAGAFDFPCLAEAFLKSAGGAVAVVGSSRSAYAVPSRNYNRKFFEALHQNDIVHLGAAFVASRLPFTANAYFDTSDHYSHLLYNLLGDPEMVVHTCSLATTAVIRPDTIGLGPTNVLVHVTADGAPRQDALVCIEKGVGGAEAYAVGSTGAGGDVLLPFTPESAGTAEITVSGQNLRTVLGTIQVAPAPVAYVHVSTVALDDDASGASAGNGDGVLDAGETFEVDLTARNDGPAVASGVGGILRIPGTQATVLDSVVGLGSLAGNGGTATSLHQARFSVNPAAPDGTVLALTFVLTDGVRTWTDHVNRVVHAPSVALVLLDVDDAAPGGNGDGQIQAGETFDLVAWFKNYGTGAADGLLATLSTSDPDVTVLVDSVPIGRAAPQGEVTGVTRFRLVESVIAENPLDVVLTDSYGRSASWSITLRGPAKPAKPVLSTKAGAGIVTATWTRSTEPDLAGYYVYRALAAGGPWTRATADRTLRMGYFQDATLAAATKYYYYVTAIDQSGNESVPSDVANINTNPAQLAGWPIQLGAQSSCPAVVGDITGDGSKEIVAGNSHLYSWNWNGIELRDDDGDPLTWGVFSAEVKTVTGAVALAEMDGNPGLEVFVTSWEDTNRTYAVRGDGSFLPGWPRNPDPTSSIKGFWAASSAVDVDRDGRAELFAPGRNGNLYAWHWDGTPLGAAAAFKTGFGTNQRTSPSFANLDADPELEIVFAAQTGQLNIWNIDGTSLPNFPVSPGTLCLSNTAVGDVNHDGVLDVVMLTEGGLVNVYNTATGTQLPGWPRSLLIKGNPISPSPALADFDGDGYLEIVVANNGGNSPSLSGIRVYDYQGNTRPGWPRTVGPYNSESSPIVADISGDGVPDIVFGNEGGLLYGWDKDGNDLAGFPITIGDFIRSTPFVDDVDGDGHVNLVLAGWDKNVYVWNFPGAWNPAVAQWPTLKRDMYRSGAYGFVFDIAPPTAPTTLASSSHGPSTWSNDPTIDVAWSGATDASGIGGYSIVWDTNPATLPDQTIDTTSQSATSPAPGEGQSHWFHLRTVDTRGNWTAGALHLGPFWIDLTPPANSASANADRPVATWSTDNTIDVTWSAAVDSKPELGPAAGASKPGVIAATVDSKSGLVAATTDSKAGLVLARTDPKAAVTPAAVAASGIAGYSIVWDTNSLTTPDASVETAALAATSPALVDGAQHWFHLRAVDAAGNASTSTLHLGPFRVDRTAPQTVVLVPNGGESWAHNSVQTIRWRATDATSGMQSVQIRYSTDGGATYPHLVANPAPTDSSYDWTVPLDVTTHARIRVSTTDVTGNAGQDASDADFGLTTAVDAGNAPGVTRTWLEAAAPNPFNPSTTLRYSLLEPGHVRLAIFDVQGRLVRVLVDAQQAGPRWYEARWDGTTERGGRAPSGVYLAEFRNAKTEFTRRLVLTK